ncbi:unnamed protein product, partial [Mesorhabditis spiculigera]
MKNLVLLAALLAAMLLVSEARNRRQIGQGTGVYQNNGIGGGAQPGWNNGGIGGGAGYNNGGIGGGVQPNGYNDPYKNTQGQHKHNHNHGHKHHHGKRHLHSRLHETQ